MRVSKAQQVRNRQQVVVAAAKLLREHGIEGVGVDGLAKAAGMTHGAVYSHFGSKDELVSAAIRRSVDEIRANWIADAGGEGSPGLFNRLVRSYVSRAHRDQPGTGCAMAAMGSDATRQGKSVRRAFSDASVSMIDVIANASEGDTPETRRDEAIAVISSMLGAIVLSRIVEDQTLSDRILALVRKRLMKPT
jgi:TetR/AcrR family transcriptional regulator, transcriptional repressor for nem operon